MDKPDLPISENEQDESDILSGENQNEALLRSKLEPIEDEPEEFINGEVDVKEQMDRAAEDIEEAGLPGDLEGSFKFTPGGLEEVEMKNDREFPHSSK